MNAYRTSLLLLCAAAAIASLGLATAGAFGGILGSGRAGSGEVRYFGDPEVRQKVAGSGTVRRKGASPG